MTNDKYPFDLVFEERYLNKSVKPKEIEESLNNKFLKARRTIIFLSKLHFPKMNYKQSKLSNCSVRHWI